MNNINQVKKDWDDLAEINAAWFNVPIETMKDHKWEIDNFFKSGRSHLKGELELINSLGIVLNKGAALDFGCGIGRITQSLAEEGFEISYGVDISPKMVEIAAKYNRFGDKCKYISNIATDLRIFTDNFFDLVFSTNALQHNHPDAIRNYLFEFVRILKPTGVLMFQIPIKNLRTDQNMSILRSLPRYHPKRIQNKLKSILFGDSIEARYYRLRKLGFSKKWLNDKLGLRPHINMNTLDEPEIHGLLEDRGCKIMHIEKYEYSDYIHANFVIVKKA